MKRCVPLLLVLLCLGLRPCGARAADKVTLENLLRQMTDLSLLAEFPDPPYVTKQFSSYDRASEAPGSESWFANGDRGFMLYDGVVKERTPYFRAGPMQMKTPDGYFPAGTRVGLSPTHRPTDGYVWAYATAPDGRAVDGKIPQGYIEKAAIQMDPQGHVLADMDGPGCVVRIWSANPNDGGKIHIYLDGADKPVIEAPLQDLLGGKWQTETDGKKWTPFPDPIACERSRGYNLYFPIAYAKHCKITLDRPDVYYHVDYRNYPQGTEVETFSLPLLAEHTEALDRTRNELAAGSPVRIQGNGDKGPRMTDEALAIEPGQTQTRSVEGPHQAITLLRFQFDDEKDLPEVLRSLVLQARFDDASSPQIRCPLGDFFGSAPGVNPYHSLPFTVRQEHSSGLPNEFSCQFWMPFRDKAVLEVLNLGKRKVTGHLTVGSCPYQWTDRSMHFHAKWRTETMKTRPFRDWTYCDLQGKGVFVGDMLNILNPVTAWWGEGDEKIYVDGERFPSWFGTGSEDYYAYAWSDPKPFQHAYHNQTRCDGPGTRGHTSVNRFHILDAIPFEKSFRFDMEVWHWTPNVNVTYSATSYWYARPGATDDFKEVDAKVLQDIPSVPPPYHIEGAIEGEKMKVVGQSGKFEVGPQDLTEFGDSKWSGDSHLWVRPPHKDAWVDLALPVPEDGTYHVIVYLTKARDYGVVQFSLDGKPLGKPIDCFEADRVVSTGPLDLGTVDLKKGTATLRGEVVGTNEKSVGLRYMWGLDCVVLKPVK